MSNEIALAGLSEEINQHHQLSMEHYGKTIEHAILCGELLIEAKAKVPHGQWLPWLRENISFSERSAQGYMRLAKNPQHVADMSVRDGLRRLSTPRRDVIAEFDAEMAVWLEQSRELKANRSADVSDWSIEDAAACAISIKNCERIFHRHGLCHEEQCTVCAWEITP